MDRKSGHEISIALCTYNGQQFLQKQLESIAAQTLLPTELVACDDVSNDLTIDILNEFARNAPFKVRIVRNSRNLGTTRNFEQAISLCGGEFIGLCDQDDWWAPEKLEVLRNRLTTSNAGAIFSDGFLMNENSQLTGSTLWEANLFDAKKGQFLEPCRRDQAIAELLKRNVVTGATVLLRSELSDLLFPTPAEWVHDGWLAWMMVLHSSLLACPEKLVRYRIHTSQQVGMPPDSARARLKRARISDEVAYRSQEEQYHLLCGYARSHPEVCDPQLCQRIEDKRAFAAFRADIASVKGPKWRKITANRAAYRLYAQGWRSMLKDALR